ncbi:MAG: sugar phosphate nucleotidyltransferase [Candidatus Micrarchaeia archaeon]
MRIIVDLDGTLCELKSPNETYLEVKPKKEMIELLKKLKKEGHEIIIYTSRHMRTCNGNVNKVKEKIGKITEDWLRKEGVPYDEIYFGKPYGDIIIDDMAINAKDSDSVEKELQDLFINIVIPMAGKGERFRKAGYNIPKYLIDIDGKTMLERALSSLPIDLAKNVFFIALKEHEEKYSITEKINSIMKNYPKTRFKIILLENTTRGQAETVLKIEEDINNDRGLLIFNVDSSFKSSRLRQKIIASRFQDIDGIIGTFKDVQEKWSFVKINEEGFVIETAEKKAISNNASTGLYYFTKGSDFVKACKKMIENNYMTKNEFYIIPIYNILIKEGKKIIIDEVEEFDCFGTPEDLNMFYKNKVKI